MHAEATRHDNSIDPEELVRMVGTLQDELRSMRSHVRELSDQRAEPTQDVDAPWNHQDDGRWQSESRRVIDEVGQLMRQYEAAADAPPATSRSARRRPSRSSSTYSTQPCSRPHVVRGSNGPAVGPDFFKKMFMFMMSELA